MESFWDKLKTGIREGATVSAEKVELYSKIGKHKVEQFSLKKKIDKNYTDIGMRLYDLIKDGKGKTASEDIAVEGFIKNIDSSQVEIDELTEKIEELKIEKDAPSTELDDEVLGV
jgi:hypothetical protein